MGISRTIYMGFMLDLNIANSVNIVKNFIPTQKPGQEIVSEFKKTTHLGAVFLFCYYLIIDIRLLPVISGGWGTSISSKTVGATSARNPEGFFEVRGIVGGSFSLYSRAIR